MAITLHSYSEPDLETWRSVVSDPSLVSHFDMLQGPTALEAKLQDSHLERSLCAVARQDGEPAGFCFTLVLQDPDRPWAAIRLGVVERHRRRGIGTMLLATALDGLLARGIAAEAILSTYVPNPEATAFVAHHGFRHDRFFWRMERASGPFPEVLWPPGIEPHTFDGSERAFEDWNAAYNLSFADHYRFVSSTVENCRALMARPVLVPDGLMLGYRGGVCVGFCRTSLEADWGEVAIVGVVPEARGVGLGRALLRWGVQWAHGAGAARVILLVDGDNDAALRLYRSEGFDVARTREIWSRRLR